MGGRVRPELSDGETGRVAPAEDSSGHIEGKQAKTFYIRDIFSIIWKRKWLLVIPAILVTVVTAASTFYLTPVFESSVTIFMEKPVRLSQDLQRLIGGGGSGLGGNPETQSRELQSLQNEIISAPFISQLSRNIGLDKDPGIELMARQLQVQQPDVPLDDLKFDILLETLRNRIHVEFAGLNQVRIIAQSSDPERSKLIAQNLGDIFIQEKTKQESRAVSATSNFSSDQLEIYERDLQDKINQKTALETEQVQMQVDEGVASEANRRQIAQEIQGITLEISNKENEVRELQLRLASLPGGLPSFQPSESVTKTQGEINQLLGSTMELMQKYSWNAPSLVSFKVRLYELMSGMDAEVDRLVKAGFSDLSAADQQSLSTLFATRLRLEVLYSYNNNLKLAVAEVNRRVSLMPGYAARIEQLDREIDAARLLRDQFKLSTEGTQISQALLSESKFRVVEPARTPRSPIWPNKRMIVLLGFLVGISLGVGAVIIAEFFDNSIKKIDDAEQSLGFAVVGTIPRIEGLEKLKVGHGH